MSGPHVPAQLRARVRKRAKGRCEYCQYPQQGCYAIFNCDHVLPFALGGPTSYENLVWACPTCNVTKGKQTHGSDPATGDSVPLFNPRLQKWPDHFRWSEDNLRVIGRTPTGRATVRALRMNRHGVARVRTYLIARGVHPPPPA